MRLTRAAKERISAGIGALLFLVAFVGLGSVGLWGVGKAIYDGWRARAWVPVQAQIAHVERVVPG